ncbi:hypothetical protein HF086_009322 [Spodoptera exigua]|uniref:Uncharacterized protein n=1 Tax=Spodoptera exigua TaxID=7107 RepID=A0A922SHS0_SPOEX|nr:hypothetical protein HF086_009322 [Spodoptera exigua]
MVKMVSGMKLKKKTIRQRTLQEATKITSSPGPGHAADAFLLRFNALFTTSSKGVLLRRGWRVATLLYDSVLAYLPPFVINLHPAPWTSNIYMLIRSQFCTRDYK